MYKKYKFNWLQAFKVVLFKEKNNQSTKYVYLLMYICIGK